MRLLPLQLPSLVDEYGSRLVDELDFRREAAGEKGLGFGGRGYGNPDHPGAPIASELPTAFRARARKPKNVP